MHNTWYSPTSRDVESPVVTVDHDALLYHITQPSQFQPPQHVKKICHGQLAIVDLICGYMIDAARGQWRTVKCQIWPESLTHAVSHSSCLHNTSDALHYAP